MTTKAGATIEYLDNVPENAKAEIVRRIIGVFRV